MIVPEPCGYAVLPLITIIHRALRPDEKTACSSWCSPEVFSRQQQGERGRRKKGEEEEGGKKGGREKEREREKREGSRTDRQAQLDHLGCLLARGVTTGSSLSGILPLTASA